MKVSAVLKNARVSAQKARLVADLIRGKSVEQALNILTFSPKKSAELLKKVLESAIANAEHNNDMNVDNLFVSEAFVDQGPTLKRIHPRSRGQAFKILKRSSHVTVAVKER